MPISPYDGERYGRDLARSYSQVNYDALEILSSELNKDIEKDDWAGRKFNNEDRVRQEVDETLQSIDTEERVRDAVESAYDDGSDAAISDLKKAASAVGLATLLSGTAKTEIDTGTLAAKSETVRNITRETVENLSGTRLRVLSQVDDVFTRAVRESMEQVAKGNLTRRQASQKVLNKLANQGIGGFIDSSGRSWNLRSYSEMSMRTATGRSAINGHLDRMQQNGRDLVIVSSHADSCQLCGPWQGRILSISGASNKYPSLGDARSGGLFHPNCRHSVSAYVKGLTEKPDVVRDQGQYRLRQQQRYNERNIRKWKRRKAAAMEDKVEQKAQSKVSEWQARQRELVGSNKDLKRLYYREQIEEAR